MKLHILAVKSDEIYKFTAYSNGEITKIRRFDKSVKEMQD